MVFENHKLNVYQALQLFNIWSFQCNLHLYQDGQQVNKWQMIHFLSLERYINHHSEIVQVWIMILKRRSRNHRIMIGKNALKVSSQTYCFGTYHYTWGKDKDCVFLVALRDFLRICPMGASIIINLPMKSHRIISYVRKLQILVKGLTNVWHDITILLHQEAISYACKILSLLF